MALYIVKDIKDIKRDNEEYLQIFGDSLHVQHEFCKAIEDEVDEYYNEPFLSDPAVQEYLGRFGIRYLGNYIIESDNWGSLGKTAKKQFVTYLYYSVQLGCLALHDYKNRMKREKIVITDYRMFECEYILPVLEKRDVYYCREHVELYEIMELLDEDIEIIAYGKSSKDMEIEDFIDYIDDMFTESQYLTRELDAKVFGNCNINILEPEEMDLKAYIDNLASKCHGDTGKEYEYFIEEHPFFLNTRVLVNGVNKFTSCMRRYPIHYLFHIDGAWKYVSSNSCKWPNAIEILEEAALAPYFLGDLSDELGVKNFHYDKVFSLVLNCDEICEAEKYWEYVCFFAKYDKNTNFLEICDKDKGLLEFHELLQQSEDLVSYLKKNYSM